jgi:hypothetical protein
MQATRDRCWSVIFDVIMIGSFKQRRRDAASKKGFDHVGENGTCLGEVECRDGRIHSVEFLAAAEELGVDRTDFVERLAHVAVQASSGVAWETGDLQVPGFSLHLR